MTKVTVTTSSITGKIRPMHATNNAPVIPYGHPSKMRENFTALEIPYVRNHDASLTASYGCQHVVDIHCIFPDFSKDENDPANYDFTMTDRYNKIILEHGAKIFYRLGSSIEHWVKKYGTLVPKDFDKWARICEHVIMHYNEGWADGFYQDIEYWEIWNEPDLDPDDATDKRTWGGTKQQFFDFYKVVATYLKNRFPHLKIGGPASCGNLKWSEDFIAQLGDTPLDFFSYHMYAYEPKFMAEYVTQAKEMLTRNGYGNTETILNEWNYVRNWSDSIEYTTTIHSMKGAAYVAATMCAVQNTGALDMLMYYDARQNTIWNGMFDFYTGYPLKGYYPFKMFSQLYKLGNQTLSTSDDEDIIVTSASCDDKQAVMICYYALEEGGEDKVVAVELDTDAEMLCYVLDEDNDCQCMGKFNGTVTMKPNSVVFLTNKEL